MDPLHGKLYYADDGNAIHVANLDGSGQSIFKALPSGAYPFDVESDPANGKLYWNQYSPGNNREPVSSGGEPRRFGLNPGPCFRIAQSFEQRNRL